jgi:polyhydroxyalkanoate synthesis regulator phasin
MMNNRIKSFSQHINETGEPDQEYDKDFFNDVVKKLGEAGFDASHKEFDKYQGVYIFVSGVDTFWIKEYNESSKWNIKEYTIYPEGEPDVEIVIAADGDDKKVDVLELVTYCRKKKKSAKTNESVNEHHDDEWPDTMLSMSLSSFLDGVKETDESAYNEIEKIIGRLVDNGFMNIEEKKKAGLWANMHAKRKRGEKPAKPGDEDYPDKKAWDDAGAE